MCFASTGLDIMQFVMGAAAGAAGAVAFVEAYPGKLWLGGVCCHSFIHSSSAPECPFRVPADVVPSLGLVIKPKSIDLTYFDIADKAVHVEPMEPMLKASGIKRLKL